MKLPIILAGLFFALYFQSSQAVVNSYQVKEGDSKVIPIAVWISCNGRPIALITSTSYGMLAGDVVQIEEYLNPDTVSAELMTGAMEEAIANNAMANIDLGEREWFECRVK